MSSGGPGCVFCTCPTVAGPIRRRIVGQIPVAASLAGFSALAAGTDASTDPAIEVAAVGGPARGLPSSLRWVFGIHG